MQDDAKTRGDEAGEWLRARFEGEPDPASELIIRQNKTLTPAAHERLLQILFGSP